MVLTPQTSDSLRPLSVRMRRLYLRMKKLRDGLESGEPKVLDLNVGVLDHYLEKLESWSKRSLAKQKTMRNAAKKVIALRKAEELKAKSRKQK